MLERNGVSGQVSDHAESDYITDERVVDYQHIQVYRLPGDDTHVRHRDPDAKAHDVVIREAEDDDGNRKIIESHGFFNSEAEAAQHAVELASERSCVVWDEIFRLE
ncbi:hypothetical protein [Natronobacterium gregoryi]|uniref:Uncharacterized protein n=2 Tax=Natronobacterium gregoryi TaxID=44930 RepID=L0AN75_NATGS|nr:hypothetical protein [Natronobacterium gregoryi]AFZ74632.1 hypothetical protein Natgr_3514 [Natronobacterium gregoryi SP2]ELY72551.1 hypothetical protein C490_03143 [Natronobacterium gregoryi SP2]PLK19815.1 hypothetical protein CYV19_12975 [Natronobacterium gregoryi SP2]SFJ30899.1 hypothetical protein SAMN05443661_12151 [Natronobacterium gregoryi]